MIATALPIAASTFFALSIGAPLGDVAMDDKPVAAELEASQSLAFDDVAARSGGDSRAASKPGAQGNAAPNAARAPGAGPAAGPGAAAGPVQRSITPAMTGAQGAGQLAARSSAAPSAPTSAARTAPGASSGSADSSRPDSASAGSTASRATPPSSSSSSSSRGAPPESGSRSSGSSASTHSRPETTSAPASAPSSSRSASAPSSSRSASAPPPRGSTTSHVSPSHAAPASRPPTASNHVRPGASYASPPPRQVYHAPAYAPPRWNVSYHRHYAEGPRWHPAYWGAGVFVYTAPARPAKAPPTARAANEPLAVPATPARAIDRDDSLSLGLRAGTMASGYDNGSSYSDFGMGVAARYRPTEAVGLEVSWMHHDDAWNAETERVSDPLSASVQLFAFPWTKVSPYAFGGLTYMGRQIDDEIKGGAETVEATNSLFGPHGGLGIEFAVGKKASLNFEGRYTGFINQLDDDPSIPGALSGAMGMNFYF